MMENQDLYLFELPKDPRFDNIRDFFNNRLCECNNNDKWFPSARELSDISDSFGVLGTDALKILKKSIKKHIKLLKALGEDNIHLYMENLKWINFCKNKLKNELKDV